MPNVYVHPRENIEWSIHYAFHAPDEKTPRVLLIGDSICNGYGEAVQKELEGKVNVSFWASAKCVTDPRYLQELTFILDEMPVQMICFNNGLHSMDTPPDAWEKAYRMTVDYLSVRTPHAPVTITLCTPQTDEGETNKTRRLNAFIRKFAEEKHLPMLDLFSLMEGKDTQTYWRDVYHFSPEGVKLQAELIAAHVLKTLHVD